VLAWPVCNNNVVEYDVILSNEQERRSRRGVDGSILVISHISVSGPSESVSVLRRSIMAMKEVMSVDERRDDDR
jgi:hypothetical protein